VFERLGLAVSIRIDVELGNLEFAALS